MVLDGNLKRGTPILAKADKVGREPAPQPPRPAKIDPSGGPPVWGHFFFISSCRSR